MEIPDGCKYCMHCGKPQVANGRKALKRPNGAGSVYYLGDRRKRPWVAVITRYNDNVRETITIGYYEQKTDALRALDITTARGVSDRYNWTLEDIYNDWAPRHFAKLTKNGIDGYKSAWNYLSMSKGEKMRDAGASTFQCAIDKAVTDGKSRSTCEKIRQLSSQLCKSAMQDDIINKNYAQFLVLPEAEAKEKETFTQSEIDLLFKHEHLLTAQIILVLIYSGMRIDELLCLTKADIHLKDRYIVGGEKTEAGRDRIIPIHNKVYGYVKNWYKDSSSIYLLPNEKGGKMNKDNFRKRNFYPLLVDLGIIDPIQKGVKPRLTPHSTRHTFISMMVKNDAKPELLQKIVGHEQYDTTIDYYTHIGKDDIKMLVDAVNAM